MVCLSEGNTVNAQLENMILEVRNYDDEMSGHHSTSFICDLQPGFLLQPKVI